MWWLLPTLAIGSGWFLNNVPPPPPSRAPLWKTGLSALGASTSVYVGLAVMEGLHNRVTKGSFSRTLAEREERYYSATRAGPLVTHGGLALTVVGLNLSVYLYCRGDYPRSAIRLSDTSRGYWTLLTSAFCHTNLSHLSGNMAMLVPEIPHMLQACGQSPYQFIAFYVSAAFCSSYAQHLVSYNNWSQSWFSRITKAPIGMGASGVAMAIFAASCFSQPTFSASFFISGACLAWQLENDIQGLLYSNESIGFVAHLSGAAFGAAYAYLRVNQRIWKRVVRFIGGNPSSKPSSQGKDHKNLDLDEIVRRLNSTP